MSDSGPLTPSAFPPLHAAQPPLDNVPESASAIPPVSVPVELAKEENDYVKVEPHVPEEGVSYAAVAKGEAQVSEEVKKEGGEGLQPLTETGRILAEAAEEEKQKAAEKTEDKKEESLNDVLAPTSLHLPPPSHPPPMGLAAALVPSIPTEPAAAEPAKPVSVTAGLTEEEVGKVSAVPGVGETGILKKLDDAAEKAREDVTAETLGSVVSLVTGALEKVVDGIGEFVEEATGRTGEE